MKEKEKLNIFKLPFEFMLLLIYIITTPLYLWQSGLPQVSDMVLVVGLVISILKNKGVIYLSAREKLFLQIFTIFISYTFLINILSKVGFKPSLFFLFNFILVVYIIQLKASNQRLLVRTIQYGVFYSLLIQVLYFLSLGGYTGNRMSLSFNNPNQLAYFTLLSSIIFIFLNSYNRWPRNYEFIVLFCSFLLIFATLSTTAFLGLAIFGLLYGINSLGIILNLKSVLKLSVVFIIAVSILKMNAEQITNSNFLVGINSRKEVTSTKIDNISSDRGYNRIAEYPEYWILGSGEGNYQMKFNSNLEFHSLFGNIQVSYGLVGTFMFVFLLYTVIKDNRISRIYFLIPIFIYGITHNGVRDGFLWIILILILNEKKINSLEF